MADIIFPDKFFEAGYFKRFDFDAFAEYWGIPYPWIKRKRVDKTEYTVVHSETWKTL